MDRQVINNIKMLGIDMIRSAKSGHSGITLGAAPIIYTLYAKHMHISTTDSKWVNRDRFVLSAGHGSSLLYATLYMAGYNLTINDLKNFRKAGSRTPGHPEVDVTPGVDATTGPLGQGIATAVGMAIAEKALEAKYIIPKKNKFEKDKSLIQYRVYALCGDGDVMEGISYEAASLAGTLGLDNLIILYDSNDVTLDGKTSSTFKENVTSRFSAMGWHTDTVKNGLVIADIDRAISKAKSSGKPSFIEIKTIIGIGSSLAGSHEVHGKVLEDTDASQLRRSLGIPEQPFFVDEEAKKYFQMLITERSGKKYQEWVENYKTYVNDILKGNKEKLEYLFFKEKDVDVNSLTYEFNVGEKEATRITNGYVMNKIASEVPLLIGGSADVASSTKVYLKEEGDFSKENPKGRNISFGVREQAMGGILNGLALSYFKPFGSTFLAFSDYMKPSLRMAALMHLPVTYIFTHDSIYVGQDGPTHQPIEQLAMLRSTPNTYVFRPADGNEIVGSWNAILHLKKSPSALILSRQPVSLLPMTDRNQTMYGAYLVKKEQQYLHGIIIATGTEVHTALLIAEELQRTDGLDIRVVSMPCMELFLKQPEEYKKRVLPKGVRTIVIEAASSGSWHQFVYDSKYLITIDQFGISGTKEEVLHYCHFDYGTIRDRVKELFK